MTIFFVDAYGYDYVLERKTGAKISVDVVADPRELRRREGIIDLDH